MFTDERVWAAREEYSLALLMPGRLIEAGPARSRVLLQRLRERCRRVLVYAYGDWLTRYGGLGELCGRVGLALGSTPDVPLDPAGSVGLCDLTLEPTGS